MGRNFDDTVMMRPAGARGKSAGPRLAWALAGVVGVMLAGGIGWVVLSSHGLVPPVVTASQRAPVRAAAAVPAAAPPPVPLPVPAARSMALAEPPPPVVTPAPQTSPAPATTALSAGFVPPANPPLTTQATPPAPPRTAFAPPAVELPLATEAEILADSPASVDAGRFALQPEVIVLQFPSLAEQARTLNRAAGLIERAGFPHDRPLGDAELDSRIRAGGGTPETLYLGHDYRAADLLRFFDEAESAGLALTPEEMSLKQGLKQWGWHAGTNGALISLVREDKGSGIDRAARTTILRHELSHGLYFVSPAYAAYVKQFWTTTLTGTERSLFRTFLKGEGYDTDLEDLVMNETQAYLMHTQDTRFFNAAAVGIPPIRLDTLRVLFLTGMPPSWLRDCTTVPARTPR